MSLKMEDVVRAITEGRIAWWVAFPAKTRGVEASTNIDATPQTWPCCPPPFF